MAPPWLEPLLKSQLSTQFAPYARAFARVLPAASIVPALVVRGTPPQVRIAIAIALAMPIAGAFTWTAGVDPPLPLVLVGDALRGLPLAVMIATPLWIATHVGAVADVLRGAPEANVAPPPAADGARGPLATLTALLAASAWIASGSTVRALFLLSRSTEGTLTVAPWVLAAKALTDGLRLGIALSAGVLVAAIALEAAIAAIGRVAAPLSPQPIAMVARPLVTLVALALSIEAAIVALVR